MPSILYKNTKVDYIAAKNFRFKGVQFNVGDDVPEINDSQKLEVYVRNRWVIPVVGTTADLPFEFRRTVMTRATAFIKLRRGNPGGQSGFQKFNLSRPGLTDDGKSYPKDYTVAEVLAYAESNLSQVSSLIASETAGKNRATLITGLNAMYPNITLVAPNNGTSAGNTAVTLTGTRLTGTTGVTFGGTAATSIVASATSVTLRTPAHAVGAVNIVLTTAVGTKTLTNGFTFV